MLSEIAQKKILEHLIEEEGFRPFAYDDSNDKRVDAPYGKLTIGIGWNLQDKGCPREIAEYVAMYFVKQIDSQLNQKIPFYNKLIDVAQVVLCDVAYNTGVEGLLGFKDTLKFMEIDDRVNAAKALMDSDAARKENRRFTKLAAMLETGQWQ